MTDAEIQGYITLIELITSAGLKTFDEVRTLLSSFVSPADLDVILAEVSTRLARRGISTPDATGHSA